MKKERIKYTSDIAFTPSVKKMQEKYHSRSSYSNMEQSGGWKSELSSELERFISNVDSIY